MAKKYEVPSAEEILKKAVYSKNTIYDYELTYDMPDGFKVAAVRSTELSTRKDVERVLVERVLERYEELNNGKRR